MSNDEITFVIIVNAIYLLHLVTEWWWRNVTMGPPL